MESLIRSNKLSHLNRNLKLSSINNIGCEYLKIFFMFLIKYVSLRIDFLEEMTTTEIYAFLRITDQFSPIYINYTNPNVQSFYTNEYYYVKMKIKIN